MERDENLDGYVDGEDFVLTRNCPKCSRRQEIRVKSQDFIDWQSGKKLLQQAFPYLDAGVREILDTGVCDPCWQTEQGSEMK